jgi:peptide/nickel transport system permease protein
VVFNLPGLGSLLSNALVQRDYFVIQAVTLLATLLFILINLATDIAYGVIDPRIRAGTAR